MNQKKQPKSAFVEWTQAIVITLIIAIILRSFVFLFARVEGISMLDTLHEGDRLLVSKISYVIGKPDYGDIVIINVSSNAEYVKRIIGKGGDRIKIQQSTVYKNGIALEEGYLQPDLIYDDFAEVIVPKGFYFVLGDNRPRSKDSRYPSVGFIAEENIDGKVIFRVWPFNNFNSPYRTGN